jgi:hypothetical protein
LSVVKRQIRAKRRGASEGDMGGKEEELLIYVVCLSKYRLEPTARAISVI